MEDLLSKYSGSDIVLFIIILAIAIKEGITLIDWIKNRITQVYDRSYHEIEEKEEIKEEIKDLNKFYEEKQVVDEGFAEIKETFKSMQSQISMLIESDKESIKAYITEKHHYFVYEQKWIDDYSLECLEKRFAIYEKEHGNSFVLGLMTEIRELPKVPPQDEKKYAVTAEHIRKANK